MTNFQGFHRRVQQARESLQMSRADFAAFVGHGCTERHITWIETGIGLQRGNIFAVIEHIALQLNTRVDYLVCADKGRSLASVRFNELVVKTVRLMSEHYAELSGDTVYRVIALMEYGYDEALLGEESLLSVEEQQEALDIDVERLARLIKRAEEAAESRLATRNLNTEPPTVLRSIVELASSSTADEHLDQGHNLELASEDARVIKKFCTSQNCIDAHEYLLSRAASRRRHYAEIIREFPSAAARKGRCPPDERMLEKWLDDFQAGPMLFDDVG